MAIQLQAGSGVPTGLDDGMLMLENGRLSDGSIRQIQQNLKATKDYLEAVAAEFRQLEMHFSELPCSRRITFLNDSADRNATSIGARDALCLEDLQSKFCQLEMHYSELPCPRQITFLNDSADSNATSIAAARDAIDFGDTWSKGSSFMDVMFVTLSTAISNLAKHLKQAAMKQLTLGIKNLDGEVEQQMDKSKSVRSDVRHEPVNGVCDNLSQLGYDLDSLNQMVFCMKGKIMKSDEKQGLKALSDNLFPEDGSVGSDNQPRRLTRMNTVMYSS